MKRGCDPSIGDLGGSNALHCAANGGHLDIVKYLVTVEGGCDPSIYRKSWWIKCIALAASGGHLEVVKYLIEEKVWILI